ncbi:hypothetical protein [Nocardia sp. NPDC057455]|uniref:hypothetical protein n=1 Tax=Nocardia sp. NPDC057455 TaxID=3346138 RepID=UPI00366ECD37
MGHLLFVLLAIVSVAAVLGAVLLRRSRARGRIGADAATRARAAGVQLTKEARAHQWRNRPHGKPNNSSGGGAGCAGGGGGCAGGE